MKIFEISLNDYQEKYVFRPIRNKIDYAHLILQSSKYMLTHARARYDKTYQANLKLIFNKSRRLYFYSENKFFSVAYPFSVAIDNNILFKIFSPNGFLLDNFSISCALAILADERFIENPSLTELYLNWNDIDSRTSGIDIDVGIALLEEIFQFEPSYIRYDYDEAHQNGDSHPLNHFDICYSSQGTFKIGLDKKIDSQYFENTLDLSTDCVFIR